MKSILDELQNITINNEKKKINGEVYTPLSLVNDMLNKLDECHLKKHNKSIFEMDYKWFEPTAGKGHFVFSIIDRLQKHFDINYILKNMIYMSELDESNCNYIREKLKDYSINLNEGDTLKIKYDFKFDVIIGNPPFNKGNTNIGSVIWHKFVLQALDFLKDGGWLSFIHPPLWRKPNTKKCRCYGFWDKMTKERQIHFLKIVGKNDGIKIFQCGLRFDWYVLENTKCYKKTIVDDELRTVSDIDLKEWDFLPNCYFDLIKPLLF